MKRSPLVRKTPMARCAVRIKTADELTVKVRAPLKSRQLAPTRAEKAHWSLLAEKVGCIACRLDGRPNPHVSIHHVDGRTKPGCHMLVLPLCGPHHQQDDTDPLDRCAVHPNKADFERVYGKQADLIELCERILRGA
jgi:hypothetical protein